MVNVSPVNDCLHECIQTYMGCIAQSSSLEEGEKNGRKREQLHSLHKSQIKLKKNKIKKEKKNPKTLKTA